MSFAKATEHFKLAEMSDHPDSSGYPAAGLRQDQSSKLSCFAL